MGLMQLFRYPSQNAILKTVSEGLKSGKKDPGRKHRVGHIIWEPTGQLARKTSKQTDTYFYISQMSHVIPSASVFLTSTG